MPEMVSGNNWNLHRTMKTKLGFILMNVFLCVYLPFSETSFDDKYYYGNGPLPKRFKKGQYYPNRDEYLECRPIQLYITKGTKRFHDLVTYTAKNVHFASSSSRIMSSRLHSRLSSLAKQYYSLYGTKLYVLKAWVPYPDYSLNNGSLHYEGRTIKVHVTKRNVTRLLKLAIQYSKFDWVIYEKGGFARFSVIPDANLDVVFVLDQSSSVGWKNNLKALKFIRNVIEFFSIGANKTQVGLITYSTSAKVRFDLDDYHSKWSILSAISSVNFIGGWTATALGLFQAGVLLNPVQNRGARPISDGIPRVIILLTDGKSNRYPIDEVAESLHNFGVQVYTVGIGNVFLPELKFIASDPDPYHIFLLNSFNEAEGFVDLLSVTTCDTPAIVEPGKNTTTEVPEDGFRFFQTECTAFSVSVVVEQIDVYGRCNLYASTVKANPGPLDNSSVVVRNEDITTNKRIVILTSVKKYIYISVRGVKSQNLFTVIIWDRLFQQDFYAINAPEGVANQPIFELNKVLAVTTESFFYRIKDGNSKGYFDIDNTTGVLFIRIALDITRQRHHELLIVAENVNASCHRGKVTINITVVSNQLQFKELTVVSIPENTLEGTNITQVTATGTEGLISYSIVNGNINNAFIITNESGIILVSTPSVLDFETVSQYQLVVQAMTLQGSGTAIAMQVINILDINEAPVFTNSCAVNNNCQFSVFENLTLSSVIGFIVATDPDLPSLPNGILNYTILPSDIPFVINNEGRLSLINGLDRETVDIYQFTVIVSDNGTPSWSIQTDATITVMDSNDNPPVFVLAPLLVSVFESTLGGTIIAQYLASDSDIGINAVIRYSFVFSMADLPFSIHPEKGLISISGLLDADEGIQVYNISVVGSNVDGLSSSINISITVLDVNDNSPRFLQSPVTGTVVENANVGTPVTQVNATDIDSGANGRVGYQIINGNINNSFVIDHNTGLITVNNGIDRETVNMFKLSVEVFDFGLIRLFNRTEVDITVVDINDNPPIFMQDTLHLSLPEDQALGSLGITIVATDQDEPNNPNSIIKYSIVGGNEQNHFSINGSTGLLFLESDLDFESKSMLELIIQGEDMGKPSFSGTTTVNVTVTNVNDHPPVISSDVEINVREDISIGSVLAQFNATDIDQTMVHFSIAGQNNLFTVNSNNGKVSLMAPLDFESTRQIVITVQANDTVHIANATLTINVIDVNEYLPEFGDPVTFSVDEEQSLNTSLGTVVANDKDGSDTVTYFFESNLISAFFNLNPATGQITIASVLDREMLVEENYFIPPDSKEQLVVVAYDNGHLPGPLHTIQNITITLNDINDNSPVFNLANYDASISENTNGVTSLFTVFATDNDVGTNAIVHYSIDDAINFSIDPMSGVVSAIETFDRETRDKFDLVITATDQGLVPRSSTALAAIQVTDVNDNAPEFTLEKYVLNILESLSAADEPIITQVATTDGDESKNAGVRYSIEGTDKCSPLPSPVPSYCFFSIDNNGFVQLIRSLDFEMQPQHNITVIASDTGVPMLLTQQLVTINVINVDEIPPRFNGSCNVSVLENVPINSVITVCPAVDFNEITNSFTQNFRYFIQQGNENQTFSISDNGTITNNLLLDRETTSQYTLLIFAVADNLLQDSIEVKIEVLDVNDNIPQFTNGPYSTYILDFEIENYRTSIVNVSANDHDAGLNAQIVYEITSTNIDLDNNVTVLTVTASDQGSPFSLSGQTNVSVTFESSCSLQEYAIGSSTGYITSILLCSVKISPVLVFTILGQSFELTCSVLRNADVQVQFLQNSSFVGSLQTLLLGSREITFTRENVTFLDGGIYDCRATFFVITGLQTNVFSTVEIQVPARIISGPQDVAVSFAQALVTFNCIVEGVPPPSVSWLHSGVVLNNEANGHVTPNGGQLIITDVTNSDAGIYTCQASNAAGTDSQNATLNIIGPFFVIIAEIEFLSAPDPVLMCNSFSAEQFQNTLNEITNQKVGVTNVDGTKVCGHDACHPNPCVNGTCNITSDRSFQCTCVPGFIGETCNEDFNECNDLVCLNGGTCENMHGGFVCHCPNGYYGDLCEDNCLCPAGTKCSNNSQCVAIANENNLHIKKSVVNNITLLDNIVNTLLENPSSASQSRQKRNGFVTVCSGQFVKLVGLSDTYFLIWICPDEVQPPTNDLLLYICVKLIELQLVEICYPPQHSPISIPVVPPSQAEISLILFDNNGEVMSGDDALQLLMDTDALSKLNKMGYHAVQFRQAFLPVSSNSVGERMGGTFVALFLIVLISAVIGVIIGIRCRKHKRQTHVIPTVEMNEKSITITNMNCTGENIYTLNTSSLQTEHESVNPYTLFDESKIDKPTTFKRSKTEQRDIEKSSSLEKLLDNDDDGKSPSEPIYGNMNYEWHGNIGQRWENYWKTETLLK